MTLHTPDFAKPRVAMNTQQLRQRIEDQHVLDQIEWRQRQQRIPKWQKPHIKRRTIWSPHGSDETENWTDYGAPFFAFSYFSYTYFDVDGTNVEASKYSHDKEWATGPIICAALNVQQYCRRRLIRYEDRRDGGEIYDLILAIFHPSLHERAFKSLANVPKAYSSSTGSEWITLRTLVRAFRGVDRKSNNNCFACGARYQRWPNEAKERAVNLFSRPDPWRIPSASPPPIRQFNWYWQDEFDCIWRSAYSHFCSARCARKARRDLQSLMRETLALRDLKKAVKSFSELIA